MFTDDQIRGMRDFLADRLAKSDNPQGVHVHRREIEAWGAERAMDPEDAARLFEDLEGVAWRGEYFSSERFGWQGAWIIEVPQVPPWR
jgi:hypothetical protein